MVSLWDGSGIIGSERAVKFGLRRVESDRGRLGEVRFGLGWVKNGQAWSGEEQTQLRKGHFARLTWSCRDGSW